MACSPWSSHVSVRSKKSTECVQMRSLIKKNLFKSDLTFKRALFMVASVEFFSTVAHLDCFGMDVIFDQFAPWVRLTDCPLFLLRISTKMREVERYILSEYCYYMQWLGEPKKVLAAGGVEGAGVGCAQPARKTSSGNFRVGLSLLHMSAQTCTLLDKNLCTA